MKARDVMVSHVITVGPELDVKAVANTLAANGISAVPVIAIDGSIVGIISEGDLMRRAVSCAKRSWWLETAQGQRCDDASGDQRQSRHVIARDR